jgi:hypothetical protein
MNLMPFRAWWAWPAVLVLLVAGGAMGGRLLAGLRDDPMVSSAKALAVEAGRAIDADRLEDVWAMLDGTFRAQMEARHAALMKSVDWYIEHADRSPSAPRTSANVGAKEMVRLHRMSLEELRRSTAASLWTRNLARDLGPRPTRADFGALRVDRVEHDGHRALVTAFLPGEREQAFYMLRGPAGWGLVDFQPYWGRAQWAHLLPASMGVVPGAPAGSGTGED